MIHFQLLHVFIPTNHLSTNNLHIIFNSVQLIFSWKLTNVLTDIEIVFYFILSKQWILIMDFN